MLGDKIFLLRELTTNTQLNAPKTGNTVFGFLVGGHYNAATFCLVLAAQRPEGVNAGCI